MAYKTSSPSQTLELLVAYRQNPSVNLRNRVVKLNLGLVRTVAHRVASQHPVSFEDLEQVGYLGLIAAVERFDPSQGYAFSSFAVPYIRGEMLHFLRDRASALRIPRSLQQLKIDGEKAAQALIMTLGRQPNDTEIAAALNIDVDKWRQVQLSALNRTPMSLDAHLQYGSARAEDRTMTLGDTLIDVRNSQGNNNEDETLDLQQALNQLEGKTREMIESVFIHQYSRIEVAQQTGVSPVTVSRRIKRGIEELAQMLHQSALPVEGVST